jgi:hypothetical protein
MTTATAPARAREFTPEERAALVRAVEAAWERAEDRLFRRLEAAGLVKAAPR